MEVLHNKYDINVVILDNANKEQTLLAVIKDIDYSSVKIDLRKIDRKVFFTTNYCYEIGE